MMAGNVVSLDAWKGKLQTSKQGVRKNITNLMTYLENVKGLGRAIRWNELAQRPEWSGSPIEDSDLIDIRMLLEEQQFEPNVADVLPAVIRHAKHNSFHPVRDYINGLEWDHKPRLANWMQQCLGAPDTPFVRAVGRKTLIAAVARAYQPGCKVDTVLVLEGPQGIRKSSAIAVLFGEDYTAESVNLFDQHNKMVMSMMGAWCVELAEFIAIAKRDQNTVKGLLSMRSDRVVLPYAKMASDHPRQCVFFGTINPGEGGYLTDGTGNRRYWPVEVVRADMDAILSMRDQLWAEAAHAFQQNEPWWFTDSEEGLAEREVAEREKYDVWDEILDDKLRGFQSTSLAAALREIGVPPERMDDRARERCASSLRRLGFKSKPRKERDADGERRSIRIYFRDDW